MPPSYLELGSKLASSIILFTLVLSSFIAMAAAHGNEFKVPQSPHKVSIRVIDTTSYLTGVPMIAFVKPVIKGMEYLNCPSYSFLVEHPSGRKLVFDLGIRKDFENLSPVAIASAAGIGVTVAQGVREQLEAHGVNGSSIEAVIWSHWHSDHIGDPSTFDPSTALIVGPGFKQALLPGYPADPNGLILESDYAGRELREIAFNTGLKIGNFEAFDYFGDGSFYLLNSPGHAIGHMSALARVTTQPQSFILLGGDACHHGGEFRPSKFRQIPAKILPNPFNPTSPRPLPGAIFDPLYRDGDKTKPFYEVSTPQDGGIASDPPASTLTTAKVMEADAGEKVLVVMAHDTSLLKVLDFFPKYANKFLEKGWVKEGRWLFLKDFEQAVAH